MGRAQELTMTPPPRYAGGRVPAEGEPADGSPSTTAAAAALPKRGGAWSGGWSRLIVAAALLALVPLAAAGSSVVIPPSNTSGVCVSMDIRNSPQMLQQLRGCRVIEGFLQITLIDNPNEAVPEAYANFTFPELTEITGYLLLYRVNGLRNLGDLFPNLAVIGGFKLIKDYALIIYEVMNLEEIGLHSLTDIRRGSVRIEKNYMLCYVKTIDWDRIAHTEKGNHYIQENRSDNECPWCPGDDSTNVSRFADKSKVCPLGPGTGNAKKRLCWNQRHCQKICSGCPDGTCRDDGTCCDNNCLGGCSERSISECSVCRELYVGTQENRTCVSNCPANLYKYLDRRCITEEECWNMPRARDMSPDVLEYPYKPINGTCMIGCPPGFDEVIEKNRSKCIPCEGACRRECPGANIDSIQAAQALQGCTFIKGSIEISVRGGGRIVKELERGLGMITDILGSLKVTRSYPLVSLSFLKSLKKIHGLADTKMRDNTVFTVTDNQNLLELWDWSTHGDIEMPRGKLRFHFNPKLCYDKIKELQRMAKESQFTDSEVHRDSNGDKIACNVTKLNITVRNRTNNGAVISWDPYLYDDPRALLGYVIYSTEAQQQNITLYDGRDACGGDGWHVDDIQENLMQNTSVFHILTHLKPFTQYALYVKTYAIATERKGAQSDIIYIRTLPGKPSLPRNAEVVSLDSNSLSLTWSPPEKPNGNITHYEIVVTQRNDTEGLLRQRNYCVEPLVAHVPEVKKPVVEEPPKEVEVDQSKCSCDSKNVKDANDVIAEIDFEDLLQNLLYQKRRDKPEDGSRRRRDVDDLLDRNGSFFGNSSNIDNANKQVIIVKNVTSFNITDLKHYRLHMITLRACRAVENEETNVTSLIENCSVNLYITQRTERLFGADDITNLKFQILSNNSQGIVKIMWDEPKDPNSLILTYQIQYKREDIENHAFTTECITRQEFINKSNSYLIKNLNPGNYSLRVMATSLAGNGNYSAFKYFYLEDSGVGGSNGLVIGLITGVLVVVCALVAAILYRRFGPKPANFPNKLIADVNPEYVSSHYVADEWEVLRSNIEMKKELGQGSFGMVYEGIAKDLPKTPNIEVKCAIKTINEHATERERSDFLKEASVMKAFNTPHVVRLLGVCSTAGKPLVIMELMTYGDLKSYLRAHRPDQDKPSLARILQMAMEIADGMSYLSAKKFVHRDLAARNCMVSEDLTVKVGDFGMTRDIYETDYYRKGTKGLLPVRWMSPESLKDGVFTSSSDVWSYGVVLWEMATLAYQPYQGLSNDQVVRYVIDGGVMERPDNCPDKLYRLMEMTWQRRPNARPSFLQLVSILSVDATTEFKENSFFFSEEGQELYHHVQPTGIVEEPSRSLSPEHLEPTRVHAFLESDSSPPATPRAPTSPPASYRDMIKSIVVPFGDKSRGEPHELEALVTTAPDKSAPSIVKSSSSPLSAPPPNGYLIITGNNGNSNLHNKYDEKF